MKFLDEMDTLAYCVVRDRFVKYRGLKFFRFLLWDFKELFFYDYLCVFVFENFKCVYKCVL